MELQICMGSSCLEKGACQALDTVRRVLEERGVADRVTLTAAFCLGRCGEGISIKVDGTYRRVRLEEAAEFAAELADRIDSAGVGE